MVILLYICRNLNTVQGYNRHKRNLEKLFPCSGLTPQEIVPFVPIAQTWRWLMRARIPTNHLFWNTELKIWGCWLIAERRMWCRARRKGSLNLFIYYFIFKEKHRISVETCIWWCRFDSSQTAALNTCLRITLGKKVEEPHSIYVLFFIAN